MIVGALERGIRGAIIGGENDVLLTQVLEMAAELKDRVFPVRVVIQSDLGHEYPDDFSYQLNRSIMFISNFNQ